MCAIVHTQIIDNQSSVSQFVWVVDQYFCSLHSNSGAAALCLVVSYWIVTGSLFESQQRTRILEILETKLSNKLIKLYCFTNKDLICKYFPLWEKIPFYQSFFSDFSSLKKSHFSSRCHTGNICCLSFLLNACEIIIIAGL